MIYIIIIRTFFLTSIIIRHILNYYIFDLICFCACSYIHSIRIF